jgi:citrate lyase beta subunit
VATTGTADPLDGEFLAELDQRLIAADRDLAELYPGDSGTRQPVHTVYVPADRFGADTATAWGRAAVAALDADGTDPGTLADATGIPLAVVTDVLPRVRGKLAREPVEDLRIDFEDGYGSHPDDVEDAAAQAAASALAQSISAGGAPPFFGIRFKSLEAPTRRRGLRTLGLLVSGLIDQLGGKLPAGFVVTLPKVTSVDQVAAMVAVCDRLESATGLPAGRLLFEIQVETPQAVLGPDGAATVARMVHAAGARCCGLHYGTYDYSAALGVAAAYQSMEHPVACRTARQTCCPRATETPCTGPGGCTPGWFGGRWSAASTRGGTCIPPSCRHAIWRRMRSSDRACRPRWIACAPTWPRPTLACSTSPRPRRRWPRSSCAGWTAVPSIRRR